MKRIFRIIALLVALLTVGVWLATGAHRGWTKTSVTVTEIEPVTGLEYPVQQQKFVMGVELLGAGWAAALALAGASLLFKSK